MQDHVGDTFTGVISTVTNFGLFVRLADLYIEGLVHITALGRDFYKFDDVRMCLTGEKTNTKYKVGDVLEVKVAAVNLDEKKIDLVLDGEGEAATKTKSHKKGQIKEKTSNRRISSKSLAGAKVADGAAKKTKKAKVTKTEKSKVAKRKARKKRPGKNARKTKKES